MTPYRKLIVLDLDDTLWAGTIGEALPTSPHVAFQRGLKDLQERGVLLAICSKNTEEVAVEGFKKPTMVLQFADFVARRINWNDKAENVASILEELNLGPESMVFIDDNPAERLRIRGAFPEALVPDWDEPLRYADLLADLDCFDMSRPTEEDLLRTQMYQRERDRAKTRATSESLEDWLKALGTQVDIRSLNEYDLARTLQLLNKTNQMNLTTRRVESLDELVERKSRHDHLMHTVRVSDRFGDAGLTGIIGLRFIGSDLYVDDFVLSCRVMGRLVEEAMVAHVLKIARAAGQHRVIAVYVPTARNAPCLEFWSTRSGFTQDEHTFTYDVGAP
jgi:FkbH-like protein